MIIFISGAMSGLPDYNRPAFHAMADKLKANGHVVLNPATLPDGLTHRDYLHICLAMIDVCDKVVFLNGWEKSKGSRMERMYAMGGNKMIEEEKLKKCCMCDETFDVGFEMTNGDCVCANFSCCYEYCKIEGEKIYQDVED